MNGLTLLKHALVLLLVFAGGVFLAMGASSILDSPVFGVLFLGLGSYLVFLAVKLNRLDDEFAAIIRSPHERRWAEMAVMAILGAAAIRTSNTALAWLLLWPIWGTQPLVYMASVFVDRLLPLDAGFVFKGLALVFEGVYLYFVSNKTVGLIKAVSSR